MRLLINILAVIGAFYLMCIIISIILQAIRVKQYKKQKEELKALKIVIDEARRLSNKQSEQQIDLRNRLNFNDTKNIMGNNRELTSEEIDRILDRWEKEHPNWRDNKEQ